jgi:hypothetical protein
MRTELNLKSVVSNSGELDQIPFDDGFTLPRDGGLKIREIQSAGPFDVFQITGLGDNTFPLPKIWQAEIKIKSGDIFRFTENCRAVWQKEVIEYKETKPWLKFGTKETTPFQEGWDFKGEKSRSDSIGAKLALAGQELFFQLFESTKDNPDLRRIVNRLRQKSAEQECVFTINSDSFFIPWSMIYLHPPGSKLNSKGTNFEWKNFWGYRHIIEHNPDNHDLGNVLRRDAANRLATSVNVDTNIDGKLKVKCLERQQAFFEKLKQQKIIDYRLRSTKDELQEAIEADDFSDQILYFYCHGEGSSGYGGKNLTPANIKLTDGEPIADTDLRFWLRSSLELKSHPLVFINACQGGQMTTMFYQTIAKQFLNNKAVGLIGSQIDIPAEFAAEYALRLFSEFLKVSNTSSNKVCLGPLVRQLARDFIDQHNNPLGLVYSLYRGIDCYADR